MQVLAREVNTREPLHAEDSRRHPPRLAQLPDAMNDRTLPLSAVKDGKDYHVRERHHHDKQRRVKCEVVHVRQVPSDRQQIREHDLEENNAKDHGEREVDTRVQIARREQVRDECDGVHQGHEYQEIVGVA